MRTVPEHQAMSWAEYGTFFFAKKRIHFSRLSAVKGFFFPQLGTHHIRLMGQRPQGLQTHVQHGLEGAMGDTHKDIY